MTCRAEAIATLTDWAAPGDDQERLRQETLDLLTRDPAACTRECLPAHVTASALIVAADASAVVLIHHRKLGRWLQTGGHIEADDASLAAAAEREAREESGIDEVQVDPMPLLISRHVVPRCGSQGSATHLDVQFVATVAPDARLTVGPETTDVRWFDPDEPYAPTVTTDHTVRELVAAALARLEPRQ